LIIPIVLALEFGPVFKLDRRVRTSRDTFKLAQLVTLVARFDLRYVTDNLIFEI
jgi:hypothetical protein